MKPVKITERNIMFTEPMNADYDLNMGLILGNKHNFVIDTGLGSGSVAPVFEYIENAGAGEKPSIVINTHCHWDHIWGNCAFENGIIIAHTLCRTLEDKHWDDALREFEQRINGEARKCIPNLTFEGELHFQDDGVTIFHSPGHTADCISVYHAPDRILYAGDNIGDTADEPVPFIETDFETFSRLIEIYEKYPFDTCISGHNKPQRREILAKMKAELKESWARQLKSAP